MPIYNPSVVICPSQGKLFVEKKSLTVQPFSTTNRHFEPPRVASGASPGGETYSVGSWEVFEETNLKGSISGTVEKGRIFETISGNIYEVIGLTLQLVLELQPEVLVLKSGETYKLIVEGFDEPLVCRKLNSSSPQIGVAARADVIESRIDGEFSGWDGETIFKLENGQVWQQSSYAYKYSYAYRPNILIYRSGTGYMMRVDGVDGEIGVVRLK